MTPSNSGASDVTAWSTLGRSAPSAITTTASVASGSHATACCDSTATLEGPASTPTNTAVNTWRARPTDTELDAPATSGPNDSSWWTSGRPSRSTRRRQVEMTRRLAAPAEHHLLDDPAGRVAVESDHGRRAVTGTGHRDRRFEPQIEMGAGDRPRTRSSSTKPHRRCQATRCSPPPNRPRPANPGRRRRPAPVRRHPPARPPTRRAGSVGHTAGH